MKEAKEAQLFMSGACPSKCSYCYLGKNGPSNDANKGIQEKLKNGTYFDNLEKIAESNIKRLTLIGAEPSVNLELITEKLELISNKFSQLEEVRIYSSLAYPDKIINFIKACDKYKFRVNLRISCSGPKSITDKIDKSGIMSKIPENLEYIINNLQHSKTNLELHWRPTLSVRLMTEMAQKEEELDEFVSFFKKLNLKISNINNNPNIHLNSNFSPFLGRVWKYTKEDGQNFALFIKKAKKRDLILNKNKFITQFFKKGVIKSNSITCHAANNNSISIGKNIHPCQFTFLFDNDQYVETVFGETDFKEGVNLVKRNFILDVNKQDNWRSKHLTSTYRNYLKFRVESIKNIAQEMAKVGQIDEKYTEDEWASLLAGLSVCFIRSLMEQKTTQLISTSKMKLLGNGALEEMVNISLSKLN